MPFVPAEVAESAVLKLENPEPGIDRFVVLVKPVTTVGRHPSNQVCIPRNTVSRFHARIVRNDGAYLVEDLGSSNGTLVNSQRVKRHELTTGDKITFGNLEYHFYLDEQTDERPHETNSDTQVSLQQDSADAPTGEILHAVPMRDNQTVLTDIGDMESVALASRYLQAHYSLLDIIRQRPGIERLLDGALELLTETADAERGVIMLRQSNDDELEPAAVLVRDPTLSQRRLTISQTIVERCINERIGILSTDAATDSRFSGSDSIFQQQVHSAICVPLMIRTRLLGVCYLDRIQGMVVFRHSDLEFVTNLCSQLAMAIDNLRMVRERIQAEQMAIIGRTMAEVSHSIKNILGVSRPATDIMRKRLEEGDLEGVGNTWNAIHQSMDRMHSLANAMLDYSRTDDADRAEVDVNLVTREVYNTLKAEMENAGIEFSIETDSDLSSCWIHRAGLFDALMNLTLNARDASIGMTDPRIVLATRRLPGGFASVEVIDNGPGIAAELRETVFLPFFSTKGAHGNGMGLAMVQKYAREMGGDVQLESESCVRTTFAMRFPTVAPDDGVSVPVAP